MEAARVAALRGHDVTIYEKNHELGGQINILSKAPGREEFNQVTRFLSNQIQKLGIKVKLGTEASTESIIKERPDAVIVATGSRPYVELVPGAATSKVISPSQALNGEVNVGNRAIVYECTGDQEGYTTADFLGEKGVHVELLTSQVSVAAGLMAPAGMITSRNPMIWQRLRKNGVNIKEHTKIKQISGRKVTLVDVWSGEESVLDDIDTVVMATGYLPNSSLYKSLQGKVKDLYAIEIVLFPGGFRMRSTTHI